MSETKTLLNELIDPLPASLWAIGGAILSQMWYRYRQRMVTLRWQVLHQSLGISTNDALFGSIEVRYNNNPVPNLYFSTIDIHNESNSDLSEIELNLVFNDGTVIYISHGAVLGSANNLPFTESFASGLADVVQIPTDDPKWSERATPYMRRRDYRVPTLNRGASVRIGMLVQAPENQTPIIQLASDHLGLKLVYHGPRPLIFGVERNTATLSGLFTGLIAILLVSSTQLGRNSAITVCFVIGCTTAAMGAIVVRAIRWTRRILG